MALEPFRWLCVLALQTASVHFEDQKERKTTQNGPDLISVELLVYRTMTVMVNLFGSVCQTLGRCLI